MPTLISKILTIRNCLMTWDDFMIIHVGEVQVVTMKPIWMVWSTKMIVMQR
jgi:hypothetical protein